MNIHLVLTVLLILWILEPGWSLLLWRDLSFAPVALMA